MLAGQSYHFCGIYRLKPVTRISSKIKARTDLRPSREQERKMRNNNYASKKKLGTFLWFQDVHDNYDTECDETVLTRCLEGATMSLFKIQPTSRCWSHDRHEGKLLRAHKCCFNTFVLSKLLLHKDARVICKCINPYPLPSQPQRTCFRVRVVLFSGDPAGLRVCLLEGIRQLVVGT